MRLSPVIKRLLGRFISRFFTKTLASATFSAAVFSFAFLPAAHASGTSKVEKAQDYLTDITNLTDFDTTARPGKSEDGKFTIGDPKDTEKSELYYIWDIDAKGNANFKLCFSKDNLEQVKQDKNYDEAGDVFTISFQNYYKNGQSSSTTPKSYGLYHKGRGNSGFFNDTYITSSSPKTDPTGKAFNKDYYSGIIITAQGGPSRLTSTNPSGFKTEITAADADPKSDGVIHDKNGYASTSNYDNYYEKGSTSNSGKAGGALYVSGVDSSGNIDSNAQCSKITKIEANFISNGLTALSSSDNPHGGAIYTSLGTEIGSITGNFIGNHIITTSKAYGGAIYNMGHIGDINGNFIVNFVHAQEETNFAANAGAICNGKESTTSDKDEVGGFINSINGYFIGNYVMHEGEDKRGENNGKDYRKDTLGGAIINYGQIKEGINGVFIGNYNSSNKTANSGVLRNYAQQYSMAVIGHEIERDSEGNINKDTIKTDTVIDGIFIGNYSRGRDGDAFAGVMRNNGDINGTIRGLYIGNYATTTGTKVTADTNPDGAADNGQIGAYNYLKYSTGQDESGVSYIDYFKGDSGMAYGGVFYNDIKTDRTAASGKPHIGDIKATFIENYVSSTYGEAFGGSIFNQNAEIYNIDSDFQGNYAFSECFRARGGALYNDTSAAGKHLEYTGTIEQIGGFGEDGSPERAAQFVENFARGKMAQGGAIYVSNNSEIKEVYANFSGNYTKSEVSGEDSIYYYDIQTNPNGTVNRYGDDVDVSIEHFILSPTAQGGALYVADGGSTQTIYGRFADNYAETNGVGSQTKDKLDENGYTVYEDVDGNQYKYVETVEVDGSNRIVYADTEGNQIFFDENYNQLGEDGTQLPPEALTVSQVKISMNEGETAQGGALYVANGGNVQNIYASFTGNWVKNTGDNSVTNLKEVASVAQGGAIYVAEQGKIGSIIGSFTDNEARGYSKNSTTELAEGGAIYVSAGGSIQDIGKADGVVYGSGVDFRNNKAEITGEEGSQLIRQDARGGAIYVSSNVGEDGKPIEGEIGSIENITADFWSNEVILDAGEDQSQLENRLAQGGAIYVSYGASIKDVDRVEGGFVLNKITVAGGSAEAQAETLAQGGAVYVAEGGHAQNLNAHFLVNSVESTSLGNKIEAVGGGAIFVQEGGYINNIGSAADPAVPGDAGAPAVFWQNSVTANGNDAGTLEEQRARGGAIYISKSPGEDEGESGGYSIRNITGTFIENTITLAWQGTEKNVDTLKRIARGGALYVADDGRIESITQATIVDPESGETYSGFSSNRITVDGGYADNSAELIAQGGAVYVSQEGKIGSIVADFSGNSITTATATGNKTERLGGGAIYIDGKAEILSIGGSEPEQRVTIAGNSLTAGGLGANLTEQRVRGGAIFVGAVETWKDDGTSEVTDAGSIGAIYADVHGNSIVMDADEDAVMLENRYARGGALFMADGGRINSIESGKEGKGFSENSITVSGGAGDAAANLYAGGGAIYIARSGGAGGIMAGFTGNSVNTAEAMGNSEEYVRGGAVFLDVGGTIEQIGDKDNAVEISGNSLTAGGHGEQLGRQMVQGGALYLSATGDSPATPVAANDTKTVQNIYADVTNNTIWAYLGEEVTLSTTRDIQGGAIYLGNNGSIENIIAAKDGFVGNGITVKSSVKGDASQENVYGGAIFVADGGAIDRIEADFIGNYAENTGSDAEEREDDEGKIVHNKNVKGGAIYLGKNGRIDHIGTSDNIYRGNYVKGSGEVRGGALFVSYGLVEDIHGDFLENQALGTEAVLTYGGAVRFDGATIYTLDSNFTRNISTGHGGALSLTDTGKIYEVSGNFLGNTAILKGGAVENLGDIGMRGHVVLTGGKDLLKGDLMMPDYSNVEGYGEGELSLVRDATDLSRPEGNRLGHWEYDGSFTGGFINSTFLYNTIHADERGYGAAIYTDKDLFVTVSGYQETIMSGNHVRYKDDNGDYRIVRSALYVDNSNYFPVDGESDSLVIYVVAKDNGILRIDDNIRSYNEDKIDPVTGALIANEGFTLRLRGYTTNTESNPHKQPGADTGLIILNNRVENSYSIMDDVTLYIGYRLHTYQNEEYINTYRSGELEDEHIRDAASLSGYKDLGLIGGNSEYVYLVGDEFDEQGNIKDIIRETNGTPDKSAYLSTAGVATKDGKEIYRADHQSDVFRDSHLSVRSGQVALTETTYASKINSNHQYGSGTEMMKESEVFTEYLFGSLIAYGVDYNYADYGTEDERVQSFYSGSDWEDATYTDEHGDHHYKVGGKEGLYASFEFGVTFDDLYEFNPKGKNYYMDMNGSYTENSSWLDANGEVHDYKETDVPVKRQMAKSDVLSVFAIWDDTANNGEGGIQWEQTSKGRVTLNGITVKAPMDGWKYTKKSVNGAQTDDNFAVSGKDDVLNNGVDHFNRDIYLQLINFTLLDTDRKEITKAETLERFHAMFEEAEEKDNLENGYHLLRLSDHFNLVQDATAYMRGSQILADEIELATTLTKDDSIRVVNWRDHLAEWAEHEGSLTGQQYSEVMGDKDMNQELSQETLSLYEGRKHFLLDQSVYYLNRNINLMPNPTNGDDTTGAAMWGQYLTIEGQARWHTLDLQRKNMLSWIINDQEVRLQSFSLTNVQDDHMENEGHLILDTMHILDGKDFSITDRSTGLVVNNAGTGDGAVNANQMTVTGLTDINFTITTEAEPKQKNKLLDGTVLDYYETKEHGTLIFDHSTQVTSNATNPTADAEGGDQLLGASVVHIKGVVEHQNIFHYGDDNLKLASEEKTYQEKGAEAQTLPTYSIETGHIGEGDVRETFTTNTYLNTTVEDPNLRNEQGYYYVMSDEFRAFIDNSLTMNGGAFNLGHMYKHRLVLRDFAVNGGGVFVEHSVINLREEVMGGIDTTSSATYKGDEEDAATGKSASGTGNGLIWLDHFNLEGSSDKMIVHVKFVDDGVGNAVKDGMGIADGSNSKGNMRIMRDGEGIYNWEVTYNDEEAVNEREHSDVGIRGMYTFRRRGFTPEAQIGPVTDMTGSFVSMMQVYNYAFQHADMFADSMADAMRESLYERSYSAVTPVKGDKNAAPSTPALRPCVDKNGLKRGMWLNTYASTEEMPLHNGPKVHMNMYGGFIGGDSSVIEHRNGWDSVWSLYGGYMGSTQRYEGVRIRQNGAAIGGTGTFYKGDFYTALTASVGVSQATATGAGGREDFDMLMGGIASRTGYNFRLDGGRYVLQPNVQLSYTMFNTFDYTNAYGSRIEGKPTGVFQVHPFVKLIMKTDCTWKPYGTVGFVYNAFGKTRYAINGTNLPSVSVDPYAEYSVGVQRSWKEGYTLYIQATGRNGGRNGAELSSGLRWTW